MTHDHENEPTYANLEGEEKLKAVSSEMLPFLIYAAVPILLTIAIAKIFGPSL
jgi:hypothetical protein